LIILTSATVVLVSVYFGEEWAAWWQGLKWQLSHQDRGHSAFFLGQHSREGWWYYFPTAFLIKTPIGTLALVFAAFAAWRLGRSMRPRESVFLLAPVVLLFAGLAFLRVNIGLRYALLAYPLLFVATSRLVTIGMRSPRLTALALGLLVGLTALSTLAVAPHQLAYFNEIVGGPAEGYRYLGDSNLDWGQDLGTVKEFMIQKRVPMIYLSYFGTAIPESYGIRYQWVPTISIQPVSSELMPEKSGAEYLAISVVNLQGTYSGNKEYFAWLRGRVPVAKLGYSIYVFDLSADPEAHVALAKSYYKLGQRRLAIAEVRKTLRDDPTNRGARALLEVLQQR
jgi:hypothetical protein